MEALKSIGECLYCKEEFSQKEIGKHLAKHLNEQEKKDANRNTQTFCHIEVESGEMFLHLLVKGDVTMKKIDNFLKDIWLDCCGHLSNFGHKNFKVSMSHKVEDVFETRIKIYHDYDYGDTTTVFLKGLKNYQLNSKEAILLLSRNEPLKIMCSTCKKEPAINICVSCWFDQEAYFCERCSEKHEEKCDAFADYSCMPVVNSPRMGICGYTEGMIDLERDGAYQNR
jgi:hypothetical protein